MKKVRKIHAGLDVATASLLLCQNAAWNIVGEYSKNRDFHEEITGLLNQTANPATLAKIQDNLLKFSPEDLGTMLGYSIPEVNFTVSNQIAQLIDDKDENQPHVLLVSPLVLDLQNANFEIEKKHSFIFLTSRLNNIGLTDCCYIKGSGNGDVSCRDKRTCSIFSQHVECPLKVPSIMKDAMSAAWVKFGGRYKPIQIMRPAEAMSILRWLAANVTFLYTNWLLELAQKDKIKKTVNEALSILCNENP